MISALESIEQGRGLYSFGEVARYLHVPASTLRAWFRPKGKREPLLRSEIKYEDDGDLWLSFSDFIEAWVTHYLKEQGAKPKAVREAIERCESEWGIKHPLSMKGHRVWVDKTTGQIVIQPPNHKHPIEATGKHRNQLNDEQIIGDYLNKVEYDENGIAKLYVVWEGTVNGEQKRVVMQPDLNFGEPTVEGTPYRASTLRDAAVAEGCPEEAAEIYDVKPSDVIIAIEAYQKAPELKNAA